MKYKVKFSPMALQDLDEIHWYISDILCDPTAADRIVNGILDKTDLLADQPEIGTRLLFPSGLDSGYRYLIFENYLAFYRFVPDQVYIDRVIYGKRDYLKILFG